MKINPEHILLNKTNITSKNKIFLINGNEETLASAIEKHLINLFKEKNFSEVVKIENVDIDQKNEGLFKKSSLFHNCDRSETFSLPTNLHLHRLLTT